MVVRDPWQVTSIMSASASDSRTPASPSFVQPQPHSGSSMAVSTPLSATSCASVPSACHMSADFSSMDSGFWAGPQPHSGPSMAVSTPLSATSCANVPFACHNFAAYALCIEISVGWLQGASRTQRLQHGLSARHSLSSTHPRNLSSARRRLLTHHNSTISRPRRLLCMQCFGTGAMMTQRSRRIAQVGAGRAPRLRSRGCAVRRRSRGA